MLVVVSKIKAIIKAKKMNTSAEATGVLSAHIEAVLEKAVVKAQEDGRKTVMARDIEAVLGLEPKKAE